jgi:hypothetical protein
VGPEGRPSHDGSTTCILDAHYLPKLSHSKSYHWFPIAIDEHSYERCLHQLTLTVPGRLRPDLYTLMFHIQFACMEQELPIRLS